MSRSCEVGGCFGGDATPMNACGTVYVCPACRAQIEGMSAQLQQEISAGNEGWKPTPGAVVDRRGDTHMWVIGGYEDDDFVWVHRPDARMVPAIGRNTATMVDLAGWRDEPEHSELVAIADLSPATAPAVTR